MEITIVIIATVISCFIKGACGFANTLVFNAIAGFAINNVIISPVDVIMNFPSNSVLAFGNRKKIQWKTAIFLSILVVIGAIPGAFFLKNLDASLLKIIFGVIVILIGFEMWISASKSNQKNPNIIIGFIWGLASGVMCGMFGVGALLGAYVSKTTSNIEEFKGTLSIVFLVDGIFRIVLYSVTGILNLEVLKLYFTLLPFALTFLFIGIKCAKKVDESILKKIVIILLIMSGASMIVTNL